MGDRFKIKTTNGEIKTYTIVNSKETDPANGFLSDMCPIGRAVIGAAPGEKRKYVINEKEFEIEILEVIK